MVVNITKCEPFLLETKKYYAVYIQLRKIIVELITILITHVVALWDCNQVYGGDTDVNVKACQ